ncbi:MAG: ECF transporter S component [Bacillota bacterium]
MNINTKQIAHVSLFVALIAVMTLVPQLGLLTTPIVSINIILIPCLVASQTLDLKSSVLVSTFMGIFSMINSYLRPVTVLAFAIQNPLVSIFPRIFVGAVAYLVYHGVKYLFRNNTKKIWNFTVPSVCGALAGTLTNTTLFLGMLYILYNGSMLSTGTALNWAFIWGIVAANTVPEIIIAILAVPVCSFAVQKVKRLA